MIEVAFAYILFCLALLASACVMYKNYVEWTVQREELTTLRSERLIANATIGVTLDNMRSCLHDIIVLELPNRFSYTKKYVKALELYQEYCIAVDGDRAVPMDIKRKLDMLEEIAESDRRLMATKKENLSKL